MDDADHSPGDKPQMVSRPSIKQPRRRKPNAAKKDDFNDFYPNYIPLPPPSVNQGASKIECEKYRVEALKGLEAKIHNCDASLDVKKVAKAWENLVFDNRAYADTSLKGYNDTMALELERLDNYAACWSEPLSKGDTITGKDAFEALVNAAQNSKLHFEHAAVALLREGLQDAVPKNFENDKGEKPQDVVSGNPGYDKRETTQEDLLNLNKLPQDVQLGDNERTRWQNRRRLRWALEDIVQAISYSDKLKRLDVVGFAATLEISVWEGEVDLDGYTQAMNNVLADAEVWDEYWDDDEADSKRGMNGRELLMERLDKCDKTFIGDEAPEDVNPGFEKMLRSEIKGLKDRFPQDHDIFKVDVRDAVRELIYRMCIKDYKPTRSIGKYVESMRRFSSRLRACGDSWETSYDYNLTGREWLRNLLSSHSSAGTKRRKQNNKIQDECFESIRAGLEDLVDRLPDSSELKRMDIDKVADKWEGKIWNLGHDYDDDKAYRNARDNLDNDFHHWREHWNSISDIDDELNGQQLFAKKFDELFGPTYLEPEEVTRDELASAHEYSDEDPNEGANEDDGEDDVSSHGETDFYDNEDANEDANAGDDLISPKSPPNLSPPSSPQQTSNNVPDTSNTPPLSLEPPAEHMATDQTYDAQVRDTSFNFNKLSNGPQESSFQLPGISFGGASASSTSMAPAYSPQDMVASQDPLSVQYDVQMDCEDEQFGAATTLQPVSASTLPDPEESTGDIEMSYDIPDDQAARPVEVVKSTAIVPIFSPPAAPSAPTQNDFSGSVGAANPVNTKPIFNWTPSVFTSKASTPAPFVFQGQTVVDFGVDTSSLSGLTQRPVAPQQPLEQPPAISPPTEEQQAELSAGATHPQAQQVGSTVQSDSAEEEIATSSDMASQPEADEAGIKLEGEVLPVVPQDGLGEVEETVQDLSEDTRSETTETHLQEPSSPEDKQATPSSPGSDISDGTVVGMVVDSSPAQAPQTPGASSQAQMIMDKHAEMHRDLCARMEAITATLSSLQQSGIVGQGNAVASGVSALSQEVAAFGNISEEEVTEQLAETSGMAVVPEEQEQSEVLVEASGMATVPEEQPEVLDEVPPELDIAGDAETSDLPAEFPPEAIVEKPENEDADGTAPKTSLQPLEESNAADSNLEDELAEHTGRIAQWEARQKRKRLMFAAEDAALLHHRKNPTQRLSRLLKTAKLATRIARYINEWQAEIPHDLPSLFIDGVEDLIDRYHERDNADSTRALNDIRELHNQWVCMRNTIRAWKSLLKHFSAEKLEGLRHEYNAYALAMVESPEKEKLYWRLEKKIRSLHECFHRASDHTKSHQTVFSKAWESEIGGSITNYFDYLAGVLGYYIGGLGMASS
jgi:hypothetical protein